MAPSRKASTPDNLLDLDGQLAEIDLSPVPMVLKGQTYMVRRDLTSAEIVRCWQAINSTDANKDLQLFELLVGDQAEELNATMEALPQPHMVKAVQAIARVSGLLAEDPTTGAVVPGESSAS